MVQKLRTEDFGYIVRTAADGVQEEKLAYEMGFLNNLWKNIQKKFETAPAPSLLHQELSISLRAVRDLLIQEVRGATEHLLQRGPGALHLVLAREASDHRCALECALELAREEVHQKHIGLSNQGAHDPLPLGPRDVQGQAAFVT